MEYKKRILMTILITVLAWCFVLVACENNNNLIYTTTGDNSIPESTQDEENNTTLETGDKSKNNYFESYDDLITEWKADLNRHEYTATDTFNFWFYDNGTNSIKTYYALYDIDGNGITELLFKKQNGYEDIIAYIFTMKDGEPINLFGYNSKGLPYEVPWSRVGSSQTLDNGLIDCYDGDYTIYKIAEDGYSVIKFASAQPYDYPDEARKAEAKWKYYINEKEVDYDFYVQCLGEQGYVINGNNTSANIDWKSID